jgi:predicted amidohydrolase YtcJ
VRVTIFTGGAILTMDGAHPDPELVVVGDDRIIAVGDAGLAQRYPDTHTVDLTGRTLCPGFIDAHNHLCIAALHARWADLSDVRTPDALRAALGAQAATEPEAAWVRGVGWSDLDDGWTPTRHDLDELGLDRPVIAVHYSYHQCVVSSAGLDALGLSDASADPPGGSLGRTESGALNGVLYERAFSDAHERSMAPYRDPDRWADNIVEAARGLLREGIVSVHDAACPPSAEHVYRTLAREGRLPISMVLLPHGEALLGPLDAPRLEGPPTGDGDERLRVGPVKLFADGGVLPAIGGHINGHPISLGLVFDNLESEVRSVVEHGFGIAVHAIGNCGAEATLEAFAAVRRLRPDDDVLFRMEHATLLSRDQARRMADLDTIAVVQPGFLHHMGGAVEHFRLDESAWMPFGDLAEAGVVIAGSSDAPCAFHEPLLTAARGVTRVTSKGTVLDASQSLPYDDWLRAYTVDAARAGGQENDRGRITPGLQADFVILAGERLDPPHPPQVSETWVAGDRVFAGADP